MLKPLGNISALVCDGVSHDSVPRITSGLKVCIRLSNSATLPTMDWQFTERKRSDRLACLSCLLALDGWMCAMGGMGCPSLCPRMSLLLMLYRAG